MCAAGFQKRKDTRSAKGRKKYRMGMGKIVKCPRCGKDVEFATNPFRPFCSERCRLVDLGKWISGDYRIPTHSPDEEEDGSPESDSDSPKK